MNSLTQTGGKIVVFQTSGVGDMVMATPMLSALRMLLAKSQITIIAGSRATAEVVLGSSLCEDVRVIALGKMGVRRLLWWFFLLRKERFDAAIICTRNSCRVAQLLKLLSAIKIVAGDSSGPRPWGYTHWRSVDLELPFVIANMNILRMAFPDAPSCDKTYFHMDEQSQTNASHMWSDWRLDGRRVLGIHPGSEPAQRQKRMGVKKYVTLIRLFLDRFPEARVLVFIGPGEMEFIPGFSGIDERVLVAVNIPLKEVGAMISRTRVLVAGDTALGHIAASLRVPVVTLAGPTQVLATRPWGNGNTVVKTHEDLACMPCSDTPLWGCCPHDLRCMTSISEETILEALASASW